MATRHATSMFRHSQRDLLLVLASLAHGLVLLMWPSVFTIGIGLWWCANTVSHNFVHLPFFRSGLANCAYSFYLTVLLGLPQSMWRQRHLAHHADRKWRLRVSPLLAAEAVCVVTLWSAVAAASPRFFLATYLPGWLLGLALCHLQGHYEHVRGTTSHYGWLYNLLFFNDGYHVEHHGRPGRHWSELAEMPAERARESRWPAVLRWLDGFTLEGLERMVLRSRSLQRFVLRAHQRAFRRLLARVPDVRHIGIVGGALFPRTAILLQRLAPNAGIVVIDCNPRHIETARAFLNGSVRYENSMFDSAVGSPEFDLLVIPLAFRGDRERVYKQPGARAVLVHDWLWRKRGTASSRISWLLLKRLNLVVRP